MLSIELKKWPFETKARSTCVRVSSQKWVSGAKWRWAVEEEEEEVKQADRKLCWQNEEEKGQMKNGIGQRADGYMDKGTH